MSKIYCYVDESGQHTQGDFFSVAAVIMKTVEMRDSGKHMLLGMERATFCANYLTSSRKNCIII